MATTTRQQKRTPQDESGFQSQGASTREERPGAGTVLRHAREEIGWDIYQVGHALKIRPEYLDALERNSLEGLPGPAYAMGFLKTYADFLKLDTGEMVRRFKAEKTGLGRKPDLTFPVPLTDRGIPGGGLFLTALILIALGYGTWYYMSSGRHSTPEAVEQVPPQLLNPQAPSDRQSAGAGETSAPSGGEPPAVANAAGSAPAGSAPATGTAAVTAGTPTGTTGSGIPPVAAANPPVSGVSSDSHPASASVNPGSSGSENGGQEAALDGPQSYGQKTPGHVVIHARSPSWIQVKDSGHPIFTRVLKTGETYNVPDRPGLVLRTGNAGGIEISADGKTLPPLGAQGEVKGNVVLDPGNAGQSASQPFGQSNAQSTGE